MDGLTGAGLRKQLLRSPQQVASWPMPQPKMQLMRQYIQPGRVGGQGTSWLGQVTVSHEQPRQVGSEVASGCRAGAPLARACRADPWRRSPQQPQAHTGP